MLRTKSDLTGPWEIREQNEIRRPDKRRWPRPNSEGNRRSRHPTLHLQVQDHSTVFNVFRGSLWSGWEKGEAEKHLFHHAMPPAFVEQTFQASLLQRTIRKRHCMGKMGWRKLHQSYSKNAHFSLQSTQTFEVYAAFDPITEKPEAFAAVNKLLKWAKKEESNLFILSSPTFWINLSYCISSYTGLRLVFSPWFTSIC